MSAERRSAPRIPEQLRLTVTSERSTLLTAETKNVSASGVYCVVNEFLPPMSKLSLQFDLPHGDGRTTIQCEGAVVRVVPIVSDAQHARYEVAIFFTDISAAHRASIATFVQQRLPAHRGVIRSS